MADRNYALERARERYNRRTRALERQADAMEAQAYEFGRIANQLEAIALAQAISASKIGNYGWVNTYISKLLDRLSVRLPR